MSHGYSRVDLSSLTSMFPEAGFYDLPEGESDQVAQDAAPADSYSVRPANAAPTLLRALAADASAAPSRVSGESSLFEAGDAMLFDMMGDAGAAQYGADPMAGFGNYDSFAPHWKGESSGASASPDLLLRQLADDDQAQRAAATHAATTARAPRRPRHAPRPFTAQPAR